MCIEAAQALRQPIHPILAAYAKVTCFVPCSIGNSKCKKLQSAHLHKTRQIDRMSFTCVEGPDAVRTSALLDLQLHRSGSCLSNDNLTWFKKEHRPP
jgi:hypothetical protein